MYIFIWFFAFETFELQRLDSWEYFFYLLIIVLISWVPLIILKYLKRKYDPTDYEIIMQTINEKEKGINTEFFFLSRWFKKEKGPNE